MQMLSLEDHQQLLGELMLARALAAIMRGEGQRAIALCQKARNSFPQHDVSGRMEAAYYLAQAYYLSDKSVLAVQHLRETIRLAKASENHALENMATGLMVQQLSLQGRLKEAWSVGQQVSSSWEALWCASVSWLYIYQADILREWNKLDAAVDLAEQAIQRGKEAKSIWCFPIGMPM